MTDYELVESVFEAGRAEARNAEADQEMANAIEDLRHAWKRFKEVNEKGAYAAISFTHGTEWFRAVDALGIADSRAKQAFTGGDLSPASIQQYSKWRIKWLTGVGGEWCKPN